MASSFIEFSSLLLSTLTLCSVIHYMRISCLLQSGGFCLEPDHHGKKATCGLMSWVRWILDLFVTCMPLKLSCKMPILPLGGPPYIKQENSIRQEHLSPSIKKKKKIPSPPCILSRFLVIYTESLECVTESVNILEQQ